MGMRRVHGLSIGSSHTAALAVLLFLQALFCPLVFGHSPIPNPPEPTLAELLRAAKLDPDKAPQLVQRLHEILPSHPRAADAWLPFIREAEHRRLVRKLQEHGYGAEKKSGGWQAMFPQLVEQLNSDRLHDPRRLVDAILRRLEETGSPEDMARILRTAEWYAQTPSGKWKFYATFQGILARHAAVKILNTDDLSWPTLAPLLRDLEPDQRARLLWPCMIRCRAPGNIQGC